MPVRKNEARQIALDGLPAFGPAKAHRLLCSWTRPRPTAVTLRLTVRRDEDASQRELLDATAQPSLIRLPAGLGGPRMLQQGQDVPPVDEPVQTDPTSRTQPFVHAHTCYGIRVLCRVRQEDPNSPQLTVIVADLASGTYRLPLSDHVEVEVFALEQRPDTPVTPRTVHVYGSLIDGSAVDASPFTVTGGFGLEGRSHVRLPRAPDYARDVDLWAESADHGGFAPILQIRGFSLGSTPFLERDYVTGRFVPPGASKLAGYGVPLPSSEGAANDKYLPRLYNLGTKPALAWLQYRLEV